MPEGESVNGSPVLDDDEIEEQIAEEIEDEVDAEAER